MQATRKARHLLRAFPTGAREFFSRLDARCQRHGIRLVLSGGMDLIVGGCRASGYFNPDTKVLAVAIGYGWCQAVYVALHEQTHCFNQWLDRRSVWHSRIISRNYDRFFEWLDGKPHRHPERLCSAVIALERECEAITLKHIRRRYRHLVDPDDYARQANAYLASHRWMLRHRRWPGRIHNLHKVSRHCPARLYRSFHTLPAHLVRVMERHL